MAVVSEASKEIQLDRINNKVSFLNDEIKKTLNQMNNIYLELDNKRESTKDFNGISMGELKSKKREYDDKKNHLISCITSMETQINKIPINDKAYDDDFVEDFLERVKVIESNEEENEVNTYSNDLTLNSGYTKTKSGIIVPAGKQLKPLKASRAKSGYACRATTFASLLKRVISEYRTVYYYGANGQLSSAKLFKSLKSKPSLAWFYTTKRYSQISPTFDKNCWAFDCSGLLRAVLWGWCGDTSKANGGSCLGKGSVVPWDTSGVMISKCPNGGSTNFKNIQVGECVWIQGHIGAYVGNNQCAESTTGWDRCSQLTTLGNITSSGNKVRKWTKHGKLPYVDYSNTMTDNLGNGWIAGPGNGGMDTGSGIVAQIGYINGVNASDLYESDNYYGYGEKTEFIERTSDSSVVRIVLPKATSVASLASSLSMTANNLLALNPSLKSGSSSHATSTLSATSVINSGTKIYVPASAYTAAKELLTSSYNNASTQIDEIDKILSTFQDETTGMASSSYVMTASEKQGSSSTTAISKLLSSSNKAVVTTASSTASSKKTNYATASSSGQTNSEKMRDYKGWTRVYDTGPYEGYADARIIITKSGETRVLKTVVSPTGFSEVFSNSVNIQQTAGGWFIARHGENPVNLTITGIMLDTDANAEKHAFIKEWQNYMIDKKSSRTGLLYNNSSIKIQLEGIRYEGILSSINFSKDANRPSVYNFTMNFTCVAYKVTRSVSGAVGRLGKKKGIKTKTSSSKVSLNSNSGTKVVATALYNTMTKK